MNKNTARCTLESLAAIKIPDQLHEIKELFSNEERCAFALDIGKNTPHFTCPNCGDTQDPYRFDNRPLVNRCRNCKTDTRLTVGTVMEGSRLPLCIWFVGASIVVHIPEVGAAGFQRATGLSRYESAMTMLRKLRKSLSSVVGRGDVTLLDVVRLLAQKSPASST